jgi:hypothetical protein
MQLITTEEASGFVAGLKDQRGRPVDFGITPALTEFIRVTKALGFETVQSCEGHIDWGLPFPWIDFEVPLEGVWLPPWWKVWKYMQRRTNKREAERHARNAEMKVEQLTSMLTRFLVEYDAVHGTHPEAVLYISRRQRFRFRLLPARSMLSDGYKASGDNAALDSLLETQRNTFKFFASFCVKKLERERNLIGIPDEGCRGCMGRG